MQKQTKKNSIKKRGIKNKTKSIKKEIRQEVLFNVPNVITLLRLVFIFFFIYMLFNNYSRLSLVIVFVIAALTDWFDGYFARKLNQTTNIGARMDQVIDRVFTISIVIALLIYILISRVIDNHFLLLLFLSVSREILGLPGFLIALIRNKDPYKVRYIGKLTTFLQGVALGSIILGVSWAIYPAVLTCISGIIAGFDYLKYSLN